MKTKTITTNKESILAGVNKTADAVKSTMGAAGKTVAIADSQGNLEFTKDGVSVAKAIELSDSIENIGAQLVINSANKTVQEVGDGTTATTVLLQHLINNNTNICSTVVNRILDKVESYEVETLDDVYGIAKTASNSEEIGNLFREIFEKIGFKSLISLETSEEAKTYYEIKKGVKFNSGFLSSSFANQKNGNCIFENAIIVIDDQKRTSEEVYIKLMEEASKRKQPLVIISEEFSITARRLVIGNVQKGFPICLIKTPGFGKQISENYKDIIALRSSDGTVDKISITPFSFTIYNEDTPFLEDRLESLNDKWGGELEDYDRYRLEQRINDLRQTAAIIYAGGLTPKNMKEEYDRIEDALGSVSASLEGGYSKGGGIALAQAGSEESEEVQKLCLAPSLQILKNANLNEVDELNLTTGEKINYLEEKIIDATNVIKQSLKNAYASYELFLNTEYVIFNEKDNNIFQG